MQLTKFTTPTQCTWPISHNAPFTKQKCAHLFWMVYCGIWDRCIVGFVGLVYCKAACAKFCSHLRSKKWVTAKWNCHQFSVQNFWRNSSPKHRYNSPTLLPQWWSVAPAGRLWQYQMNRNLCRSLGSFWRFPGPVGSDHLCCPRTTPRSPLKI